ncbi:MAG: DNA gyrase subunit A [Anaerolineae bacterium]
MYTEYGTQTVLELYEMPPQPLYEIELENGLRNVVTPSQAFRVFNPDLSCSWKKAEELVPGDWIVLKAAYPDIESSPPMSLYKGAEKALNVRMAYLLGLLMADGWVAREGDRRRIGFYSAEREIVERVARLLHEEVGYKATIETKEYAHHSATGAVALRQGYTVRINSDELNAYFVDNFALADIAAPTKYIPPQILQAPKGVVFAFLSGLIDGDGSVHRERNVIHYGSISTRLIEHLQLLLHHLGIPSRRYVDQRDGNSEQPFHWLEVTGTAAQRLAEALNLAHPVKRQYLAQMKHRITKQLQHEQIPYASQVLFDELSRHHLGGGWYQDVDDHKFRQGISYPGGTKIRYSRDLRDKPIYRQQLVEWGILGKLERIGSPYAEQLAHFLHDHITFMQVKRVSPHKPEKTYDIQVSHEHMFVANGMVVHNCLGKYHPHGDQAVYEAMVRMAQDFSMRYLLVDGQGNFGSVDGDSPAAMRYTEARLAPISEEMLADIDKETVDFVDNFDGSLQEPSVLPARLPNFLLNGAAGIAVGMATNVPPHNLNELCDALLFLLKNYDRIDEVSVDDLMSYIKGPDFPTRALILGQEGIRNAYATGKGRVVMRARTEVEEMRGGRYCIIITELPYQVNKSALIEKIAELVRAGRLEGIADLRDESDRQGLRVVIELKRGSLPQTTLNQLFKYTPLQSTFGVNMLALVDGEPRLLSLKKALQLYIEHRREILTRRTQYELEKATQRAHILEGLLIALKDIDAVIETIRRSKDAETALTRLMKKFKLTEIQARAILDMQLRRLAALERRKIEEEYAQVKANIAYLRELLADPRKILDLIATDLKDLKKKYGDERRTLILDEAPEEISVEDLITEEEVFIFITQRGYIKRISARSWRPQRAGVSAGDEDALRHIFSASTLDSVLFFTNRGRAFRQKAHQIPDASRQARGTPLASLIPLEAGETVTVAFAVSEDAFGDDGHAYLTMLTRKGKIKRTDLSEFASLRASGLVAIALDEGDELGWVELTTGQREIIIVTTHGKALRFPEEEVRSMGRAAGGVMAIKLAGSDRVAGMALVEKGADLLVVTARGFGKRTPLADYPAQSRYSGGVITLKGVEKIGPVAAACVARSKDEVLIISEKGMVARLGVKSIPRMGRATQGKPLIQLKKGDAVAALAQLREAESK